MIAKSGRQAGPLNLRHLLTKRQFGKFFLDLLAFLLVSGRGEAISQLKEAALLSFFRFQPGLNELHKHSIRASSSAFGKALDPFRSGSRQ
jgi:hypothetical protein